MAISFSTTLMESVLLGERETGQMSDDRLTLAERRIVQRIEEKGKLAVAKIDQGNVLPFDEAHKIATKLGDGDPIIDGLYVQLALVDLPVGEGAAAAEFIPSEEKGVRGPGEVLGKLTGVGRRLFLPYSAALHKFVCDKADADLRKKVLEVISTGGGVGIITAAFISIGIPAAAAPLAAALLLVIVVRPTVDEACKMWDESLKTKAA